MKKQNELKRFKEPPFPWISIPWDMRTSFLNLHSRDLGEHHDSFATFSQLRMKMQISFHKALCTI